MSPLAALRTLQSAARLARDVWRALFDHPTRGDIEALHEMERRIAARKSASVIERNGERREL